MIRILKKGDMIKCVKYFDENTNDIKYIYGNDIVDEHDKVIMINENSITTAIYNEIVLCEKVMKDCHDIINENKSENLFDNHNDNITKLLKLNSLKRLRLFSMLEYVSF